MRSNISPDSQPPRAIPKNRGGEHEADAGSGFAGREMIAHDQGIARHDAALGQAEEGGDDVERGESIEGNVKQQSQALQERADDEGSYATDAVGDETKHEAAHHAEAQHEGKHFSAAGGTVTQVAAIGDDMDLGHGHGHATGKASEDEQALQDGCSIVGLSTTPRGDGGAWPLIQ